MNLTLAHIYHRLVTPTPIPPRRPVDLDSLEDTLRRIALPLPNTSRTSRAISRTLEIIGRARALDLEQRALLSGEGAGTSNLNEGSSTRIPGAMIDDDEAD